MPLAPLDGTIIIGYLALSLLIGLAFKQRAGSSFVEYFASGRALPWWIAGTSMVATTFAADTPLWVTGRIAKYELAGNWLWWSFAFGGMLQTDAHLSRHPRPRRELARSRRARFTT
jgi:SSS family solute:Na+ symporter